MRHSQPWDGFEVEISNGSVRICIIAMCNLRIAHVVIYEGAAHGIGYTRQSHIQADRLRAVVRKQVN